MVEHNSLNTTNLDMEFCMKIAVAGCGLNSHYHIRFAKEYPELEIVGLVDKDKKRAEECARRHGVTSVFASISELMKVKKPDAVHIVTPPMFHYELAREVIESGCHVLVEKPLTLDLEEAEGLYGLSEKYGVSLCTMHNHFFDPCMLKARALIRDGKAGDIINVESHYGLNTKIDAFRRYPAPNVLPWIYTLPGGVFHDFMAHPLYVMLPYTGKPEEIVVMEKSHGELPQNISDELRMLVRGKKCLGTVVFSFAAKPHLHFLRIYGSKMIINVDFNTMTITSHSESNLPKAAQKATYNLGESRQLFSSTVSNVWNFGRGKLKPYQGMQSLIHQFYDSINGKSEVPVSREDALMVVEAMDEIRKQVKNTRMNFDPILPDKSERAKETSSRVLVTGATGFLGKRLVELLTLKGYTVRILARKLSRVEVLKKFDVETYFGDVADLESLKPAFDGVDYVVHAAADTTGSHEDGEVSTIRGTMNVIELCEEFKIKKLVYISSCSVYGVADHEEGQPVTEDSSLERFPLKRGHYSSAKFEAERVVREAMKKNNVHVTCLRPGTIYGPGGDIFTPMMGFGLGRKLFAIIGNGEFVLPFVYIDNLIDCIVLALSRETAGGRIYNVVDSEKLTKKQYAELLLRRLYPKSWHVYIPYWLLYGTVFMQEILLKAVGRRPFLTRYRLKSSQKDIVYDTSKIKQELNWRSAVSTGDALDRILDYETHTA